MSMFDNENFETLELLAEEILDEYAHDHGEELTWDEAFAIARERLLSG